MVTLVGESATEVGFGFDDEAVSRWYLEVNLWIFNACGIILTF